MTFSIAGFDPKTGDLGIAVHSKFPNVRVTIPFAQAGVGAVATQSYCNTSFGPKGLELLKNGATPQQVIDILIQNDQDRDYRQVGIIDAKGNAANYTGLECFDWAGGYTGKNCTVQGNVLAGEQVITAMEQGFQEFQGSLAERLIHALNMGQEAGGDRRGQQSAALLVVRENAGYGGHDDRYVDISVYDHQHPMQELKRLYELHRLTYFKSEAKNLKPVDSVIAKELQAIMHTKGFYKGEINGVFDKQTQKSLHDFMGWENYDERMRDDDLIDLEVLEDIRKKHPAG
ncbi:MAG: DUF1028 domain-containing protein [Gammaproteobacteria bacterium]|nr:DUF1028 domain-containing protein [Gammaproteobacteria bacterium]